MNWKIHHKEETASTNVDARVGRHGDVFTADFQTAGRGRLDHKWLSPPKANLMMSVVLSVAGLSPEHVSTLPLVIGLSVCNAIDRTVAASATGAATVDPPVSAGRGGRDGTGFFNCRLKWPNDVLVDGRKIAGILCERSGDNVIAGIGVNVGQTEFDKEIAGRATSLSILFQRGSGIPQRGSGILSASEQEISVRSVRAAILAELDRCHSLWRSGGFAAVYPEIAAVDFLKGREVAVRQTDDDPAPLVGVSNGIMSDGSLDVGGVKVYAGEAHVEKI